MSQEEEKKYSCTTCSELSKDEQGNPLHPKQDEACRNMLENGFKTSYTPSQGNGEDGGGGLVQIYDLRSEEEKLIEEFRKKSLDIVATNFESDDEPHEVMLSNLNCVADSFLEDFILKAYRSGKLAGFSEGQKTIHQYNDHGQDSLECRNCDAERKAFREGKLAGFEISKDKVKKELGYFDSIVILNIVNEIFKSLIEEEKKKL